MLVQPVVVPGSGARSWTVLGDDDVPVGPVERFLAYLTDIERSPNTVKAYAHDLKDFWEFLGRRGLDWREARLEDVGEFVAWLRLPPPGRTCARSSSDNSAGCGEGFSRGPSIRGAGLRCRYKVARDFPKSRHAAAVPIASSMAGK